MRRLLVISSLILLMAAGMLLNFAPDTLSLMMVGLMVLAVGWGYFFGVLPTLNYMSGFDLALHNIEEAQNVQANSVWIVMSGMDSVFRQKTLDKLFGEYKEKVNQQQEAGKIVSDIAEYINEDVLALRSWQGVVQQIPGTVTALGLLGTFIGLIVGISGIGFSSVDAALSSIEVLLSGIRTAFFTSIAGVIFSILFNLTYRLCWNSMLRQLGLFEEEFHKNVLPSMEDQLRDQNIRDTKLILEKLDRLPKVGAFAAPVGGSGGGSSGNVGEQRLMPEIQEGLQNGEFIFHVQPRYDLNSKRIVGGQAVLRWNHGEMGLIAPNQFLPLVERNGFIVRIDRHIWELVCQTIRRWIDAGYRPLPLSVSVTKTDILAMELVDCFEDLIHKYRIPPRYLEIEIAENAYLECEDATREIESKLRQNGFRIIVNGVRGDLSEMNMLKGIHADAVKVNLRSIQGDSDHLNQALQSAMERINVLSIPVMATGIENAAQLSALRSCGCAEGQGFYFCKPVAIGEFEEMTGYKK